MQPDNYEDWDASPITEQEIEDEAHEAGWTDPDPAPQPWFRTLYFVALGMLLGVALISPEARGFAALGIIGMLIWWPTFQRLTE